MITGPCKNKVCYCPRCGYIHKGFTNGGIIKQCSFCGFHDFCNAEERRNKGDIETDVEICPDCLLILLEKLVGG
ncbi:MAG: hypothetical protein ACOCQR_03425 [bacterium]